MRFILPLLTAVAVLSSCNEKGKGIVETSFEINMAQQDNCITVTIVPSENDAVYITGLVMEDDWTAFGGSDGLLQYINDQIAQGAELSSGTQSRMFEDLFWQTKYYTYAAQVNEGAVIGTPVWEESMTYRPYVTFAPENVIIGPSAVSDNGRYIVGCSDAESFIYDVRLDSLTVVPNLIFYDVTDSGVVYGTSGPYPLIWENGNPTDVTGIPDGSNDNCFFSVTPDGKTAVGYSMLGSSDMRPVIYENGVLSILPYDLDPEGKDATMAVASDIGSNGWITGYILDNTYMEVGCAWNQNHEYENAKFRQRHGLQYQQCNAVVAYFADDAGEILTMEQFLTHAIVTQNTECYPTCQYCPNAVCHSDFTECSAVRSSGNPQTAHKCQCHIPSPVENGPVLYKACLDNGIRVKAHADKFTDIGTDCHDDIIQNKAGVPNDEYENEKGNCQPYVEVTDASHTFCNGFGCRKGKEQTENDDNADFQRKRVFNTQQAACQFPHNRCTDADGGHHCHEITEYHDGIQYPAEGFFPFGVTADEVAAQGGDTQIADFFIPVQIPNGYPCHQIKRPCRKAPMEHAVSGSIFIGLHGIRFDTERRTCYIVHPFTHAKDQDTCCQLGAKVHSDPSKCFIMRLCIPSPRRISPNFVVRSTMAPTAIPKPMSKYSHAISVVMKL